MATLSVAAMEQYLISQGKLQTILESEAGSTQASQSACDYRVEARKSLANNQSLIKQLIQDSKNDNALSSWLMLVGQLSLQNLRQVIQPSFILNFYGAPQTLHTLDYEELLDDYNLISINQKENRFKNSVVFIGGSFNEPADQIIDDFNTVFTKGELPMSGVEVAATGFANLYEKNYLTRHGNRDALVTILFVSLCIALLAFITSNKKFILISVAVLLSYATYSVFQFTSNYVWLPFIIPIAAILLLLLYELFDRFYLTSKDKTKLEKNLKLYLSSTVANQVSEDKEFELEQAICLVTDVAGFTTLGETLAPEKLHGLNRAYFELLFNCVTEYGADVIKTYGDSLTAVWKVKDQSSYSKAVEAGLKILSQVNTFNSENPKTPYETRLGLSSGQIVIGYVGGETHRTVELTGDAIYTASRLEQLNKETKTKFLTTQQLIAQTKSIQFNNIGRKQLRGKSNYTDVVEVILKM